jgi:hypothetical protein
MSAHSGTLPRMANGRTKPLVKCGLTRGHNVSRNGCGPRIRIPLAPLRKAALTRGNDPRSGRFMVSVQHTCNFDRPTTVCPWRPSRRAAPTVRGGACRGSKWASDFRSSRESDVRRCAREASSRQRLNGLQPALPMGAQARLSASGAATSCIPYCAIKASTHSWMELALKSHLSGHVYETRGARQMCALPRSAPGVLPRPEVASRCRRCSQPFRSVTWDGHDDATHTHRRV